ncbi:hypothetical protein HZB94_00485 [Candidatus Falkowbacteria bacterium]|nr:hypothetical protein [Candidatus Falkowbacteria bacterium]
MDIETFKKAGVRFDHCRFAGVPEIPYVQDVLFALRLSPKQKSYDFCVKNHATYIVNIGLVIAAVGYEVLGMERYDEAKARKIIANAILELCSAEDKCLFNSALTEATEISTEQTAPSRTADRETLLKNCGCVNCREIIRSRECDFLSQKGYA